MYGKVSIPGTRLSIQPEILYSQKGAEVNDVEIKRSYLEIPVLLRVDFLTPGPLVPHIYGGGYYAFKLNSDTDPPSDQFPDGLPESDDHGLVLVLEPRSTDLILVFGIV